MMTILFGLNRKKSYKILILTNSENLNCQDADNDDGVKGRDYKGTISKTKDGLACRRWDDLSRLANGDPPKSEFKDEDENFCRNPDSDDGGVWCYTNDPYDFWQHCDVPDCGKLRSYEVKM